MEIEQNWYFTFGYDHKHPATGERLHQRYVRMYGTCDSTRAAMFAAFGNRWAFQYPEALKAARIDGHGMSEVDMP